MSSTPKPAMLEVKGLETFYGEIQVLRGVSITVNKGEIVAMFGPNGHGKSTLMKTIAGMHTPTSGAIMFEGEDITNLPSEKTVEMGLALIPEDRNLFPNMTVQENLICGAFNKNARAHLNENLDRVHELFPRLAERRTQAAGSLSGGESRMLAIARGIMSHAALLMVDEPSIGLSPLMKDVVFEAIENVKSTNEVGILVVEQEVDYPLSVADRVYLLQKGRVLFEKPAKEVNRDEIQAAYFTAAGRPVKEVRS